MRFELVTLGDYLSLQKGISYTSSNLVNNSDTGLLTINAFTLGGGYKPNSEKPFEGNIEKEFLLSDGDVLVAMTEQDSGLLASPLVVKIGNTSFERLTFSLDVGRFMKKKEGLEPRFVFNLLRIPAIRNRAAYGDSGSTVQRLPYEALYEQKVPKPTLEIQRKIINFIDMIDEKIFTNNALSKTLEEIAQTIFKSWFIDFDPVKAKINGEKPLGMDDEAAELFPDSFEESELGLIPKGWEVLGIGDIANIYQGKYLKPTEMSRYQSLEKSIPVEGATKTIGFSSKSTFNFDFASLSCRGSCGFVRWISNPAWISNNLMAIYSKDKNSINHYLYFLLKTLNLEEVTTGSVQGQITINNLASLRVLHNSECAQRFNEISKELLDAVVKLNFQSSKLSEIRDNLLPRLITGELQIPEEMLAS